MTDEYFFEYMRDLLGERYEQFLQVYNIKPRFKAARVNTLKISTDVFFSLVGGGQVNKLCPQSIYTEVKPSLDPYYHAGLYYMQEPSASAAVAAFAPYVGERVLDLCAAPGGKSTQLAAVMDGRGVLFSNDVDYKRTRALAENIERLGVKNAVITCTDVRGYLSAGFENYFDTLVCDVPCSGGGITRYEDVPFSPSVVEGCAKRQRAILLDAAKLLCGGGYMLYSTCTFTRQENEDNIDYLTSLGLDTVDIPLLDGAECGVDCPNARRVYPMNFDGEGHFYCVLKKRGEACSNKAAARTKPARTKINGLTLDTVSFRGGQILNLDLPEPEKLNIVRAGVPVFDSDGNPSHALIHALSPEQLNDFGRAEVEEQALDYLCGKQIPFDGAKGYLAVTYNGYALGLGFLSRGGDGTLALKNKYPKHLRIKNY